MRLEVHTVTKLRADLGSNYAHLHNELRRNISSDEICMFDNTIMSFEVDEFSVETSCVSACFTMLCPCLSCLRPFLAFPCYFILSFHCLDLCSEEVCSCPTVFCTWNGAKCKYHTFLYISNQHFAEPLFVHSHVTCPSLNNWFQTFYEVTRTAPARAGDLCYSCRT